MHPDIASENEITRWAMLRAIEWGKWPLFVTQPLAPVMLLYMDWWSVMACITVANLLWTVVRYRVVYVNLANFGCYFVRLKWVSSVVLGSYFFYNDAILTGVFALLWPLVTIVLSLVSFGPVQIGRLERMFLVKTGFLPEWMKEQKA